MKAPDVTYFWHCKAPLEHWILASFVLCLFMDFDSVMHKQKRTELGQYLHVALINRAGYLYGRILTEVVSIDQTQ